LLPDYFLTAAHTQQERFCCRGNEYCKSVAYAACSFILPAARDEHAYYTNKKPHRVATVGFLRLQISNWQMPALD